ncbi:cytochrome P450 [Aspergillus violaceofuscus CBS 115571]|uniref:Cytochrome P450 n=1 Tax=Aspergillus violaceofuscus (strain CBS 115571) TaxID=1450538 RepID=A0A2V5HB18_ASPV1|nr:cytochrome P450 [Aspergillus violaceofuscus CBS 115571]
MTAAILLVVQFLLADLLAQLLYRCYFHPLARYPGPFLARPNPRRFASFLRGQHHLTEEKLHQRYGPIVRVAPDWLSFSQLPAFEAIYGFHKAIEKDDFYTFGAPRPQTDVSVFATQSNPVHRQKRRRMLAPALTRTKVLRYEPVIARHVAVLVARLEAGLREQEEGRQADSGQMEVEVEVEVNVAPLVHRFTLDVMLDILFGPAVGPHPYTDNEVAGDLGASIRYVSRMVWSYSLWPAFGWLMNTRLAVACLRRPRYNAAGAMVGLNGLMHRAAAAILGTPEVFVRAEGSQQQQQQPGIVESWLRVGMGMGSSADGVADNHQKMTPAEAVSEAFNLVFAGPGSMAAALTAVLYQLGLPEGQVWQEKLRAGAGSEALEGSISMEGSSPSLSPPLELQAVIKETLRFRAPFPTAFPRVIRSGAEMAIPGLSHPLPAGTTVSASTYVLGRSREIWGEDADQWVPQRWLLGSADNDDDDEESRRQMDRRFVAFSRGPRGCSGRDLASLILAKAARAIVQRWRFSASAAAELRGASFLEMQYDLCQLRFVQRSSSSSD